jgi:hypothetical protein
MKETVIGGVLGLLLIAVPPWGAVKYHIWYSLKGYEKITVLPVPKDCEWGHAPLGDKGCKYVESPVIVKPSVENEPSFGHGVIVIDWQKVDDK